MMEVTSTWGEQGAGKQHMSVFVPSLTKKAFFAFTVSKLPGSVIQKLHIQEQATVSHLQGA